MYLIVTVRGRQLVNSLIYKQKLPEKANNLNFKNNVWLFKQRTSTTLKKINFRNEKQIHTWKNSPTQSKN